MLPMEEDVKTLKEFVVSRMKEIVAAKFEYFDYHRYVELRDAACTLIDSVKWKAWWGGKFKLFSFFCNVKKWIPPLRCSFLLNM